MNHLELTLLEFEKARHLLPKSGIVVDVGCHDDKLKTFFEEKGFSWIGIDKELNMNVREGSFENIDDITKKADLIFACHVLEHCEDPLTALKKSFNILNEKGAIFISLPCPCRHHIIESDLDHIFCFNDLQIAKLLQFVGFKDVFVKNQEEKYPDGERHNVIAIGVKK